MWFTTLFVAAFARRPSIAPRTYARCNLGVGALLLALALLLVLERGPAAGHALSALVLAGAGLALGTAMLAERRGPEALARTLRAHGALFLLLALGLAVSSVHWALTAPPLSAFAYGPGLALTLCTWGTLQLGEFGPWPERSRSLRLAGVWAGILLELAVAASLLWRAFH